MKSSEFKYEVKKLFNKGSLRASVSLVVEDGYGSEDYWCGEFWGIGLRYFHRGFSTYSDGWYVTYYDDEHGLGLVLLNLEEYFEGLDDEERVLEECSYDEIETEDDLDKWLEGREVLLEYYSYPIKDLS